MSSTSDFRVRLAAPYELTLVVIQQNVGAFQLQLMGRDDNIQTRHVASFIGSASEISSSSH